MFWSGQVPFSHRAIVRAEWIRNPQCDCPILYTVRNYVSSSGRLSADAVAAAPIVATPSGAAMWLLLPWRLPLMLFHKELLLRMLIWCPLPWLPLLWLLLLPYFLLPWFVLQWLLFSWLMLLWQLCPWLLLNSVVAASVVAAPPGFRSCGFCTLSNGNDLTDTFLLCLRFGNDETDTTFLLPQLR